MLFRSGHIMKRLQKYKIPFKKTLMMLAKASEMIVFEKMDILKFRKDIDIKTMYAEIFYAVDGYMLKKYRSNCIIPDEIEKEIIVLIDFWKKVYTQEV